MIKNKKEGDGMDKLLIENLVSLQKVTTELYVKIDNLSNQLSKLLNLFEISAKEIARKDFETGGIDDKTMKEFAKKIDNLLEQNKIIARGISLLHEQKEVSPGEGAESSVFNQPSQQNIALARPNAGVYKRSVFTSPPSEFQEIYTAKPKIIPQEKQTPDSEIKKSNSGNAA